MPKIESLLKLVYKKWKKTQAQTLDKHPDEETLVCFLENRLSKEESQKIKKHLIICPVCIEAFILQLKLKPTEEKEVPPELVDVIKNLVRQKEKLDFLEIVLQVKERILELLSTTADVLVGQELVPAPILRSRQIKEFKDQINILKDFKDIRVEAKIENKMAKAFNLTIVVKEKPSLKVIKDLRISLLKDDVELESYVAEEGKVTFENILLGKYTVEIANLENKLASILLEIKT